MNDQWKISAQRTVWSDGIELRIAVTHTSGGISLVQPWFLQRFSEAELGMVTKPCAVLPVSAAQLMMDELWHAGIRPTEGSGSAGSLAATERHLSDMKAIAFHALSITTPGKNT